MGGIGAQGMNLTGEERLKALADKDSPYFKAVEQMCLAKLVRVQREKKALRSEVVLPARQQGEMVRTLEQQFSVSVRSYKNLPSTCPTFDNLVSLAERMSHNGKSWGDEETLTFDGSVPRAIARNKGWQHTCRTGKSSKVLAEYEEQADDLRRMAVAKEKGKAALALRAVGALEEIRDGGGKRVCFDAAACRRQADTILIDTVRSDMSPLQAVRVAVTHSAQRVKGWCIFTVEMLVKDEGELAPWGLKWVVDKAQDRLYILDEALVVIASMRYSNTVRWALDGVVEDGGKRFVIERYDNVACVQFFVASDVSGTCMYDTDMEARHDMPLRERSYLVSQRIQLPKAAGRGTGVWENVQAVVPAELFDRVMARLETTKAETMTEHAAMLAVSDFSAQRVSEGTFITLPPALQLGLPQFVAKAAWKQCALSRAQGMVEEKLLRANLERSDSVVGNLAYLMVAAAGRVQVTLNRALDLLEETHSRFGVPGADDYRVTVQSIDREYVLSSVYSAGARVSSLGHLSAYYPGGPSAPSDASSVTSSARLRDTLELTNALRMLQEEDAEQFYDCNEHTSTGDDVLTSIQVVEDDVVAGRAHVYDERREQLVGKAVREYGAVDGDLPGGTTERYADLMTPDTAEVVPDEPDPVAVLNETYDEVFPGLGALDHEIRTNLIAESDRAVVYDAPRLATNASRDLVAEPRVVRSSNVQAACSGRRAMTQAEVLRSVSKRIANAPSIEMDTNLAVSVDADIDKFISVCFREDWRVVVAERVHAGMWMPHEEALKRYALKLDASKVNRMLTEKFILGEVDLTSWLAMTKPTPKPKTNMSAMYEHSATQTIIYQESKMCNMLFSTMTSAFHDTLDACLDPRVRVNARIDKSGDEEWFNSLQPLRVSAKVTNLEADVTQCDKSQRVRNLMIWLRLMERMGAPESLTDLWSVLLGKKRATANSVGMAITYVLQVLSGFWGTISVNSVTAAVASVVALDLRRNGFVSFAVRGDDVAVELLQFVDKALASERYRDKYNFEAKVFSPKDLYYCSRYWLFVHNRWCWMVDPVRAVEQLARALPASADIDEQFVAFRDKMVHYDDYAKVRAVCEAATSRLDGRFVNIGMGRALSNLAFGENAQKKFRDLYSETLRVIE